MPGRLTTEREWRTYAERRQAAEQADLARRRRNRMLALAALIVVAGIVVVQLWR